MRTLFTYGFYFFGVSVVVYELVKLGGFNPLTLIKDLTEKADAEKAANTLVTSEPDKKMSDQITFALFGTIYFVWFIFYMMWTVLGLLSSQWPFFLTLFILSFVVGGIMSKFKAYTGAVLKIDAFITIVLLVMMFLNRFHLHWI